MAGITAHLLATVVFFSILASGKIDRVAAYRPRFFAFQNRHSPHPVVVAAITKDSSWLHGNPPPLQATSNTEKNIFVIPTSPNNKLSLFSSWKSLSLSERPLAVEVAQRPKDSASQQTNSASNGMSEGKTCDHNSFLIFHLKSAATESRRVNIFLGQVMNGRNHV